MEVRQLVGGTASTCEGHDTIRAAAKRMSLEGIGSLGVVESGALLGMITERDVLRAVAEGADPEAVRVDVYMTSPADFLSPDADISDAVSWMLATGHRHLPVVEDGRLLGIASIKDVLWAMSESSS